MDEYKKEKLRDLFSSKQFVVVLAIAVVITVVGGYYAHTIRQINKITVPPVQTDERGTISHGSNSETRVTESNTTAKPAPTMPEIPNAEPPASVSEPFSAPSAKEDVSKQDAQVNQNIPQQAAPTVFSLPLGTDIGKDFSRSEMVFNSTLGDWRVHNGIDFLAKVGDTVKAVAAGTVKAVYDDPLWGTVVEIDHGGNILAKYCGLGKGSTVKVGDKLKMNDTVGNLGIVPIEKDEPDHLHFEVYVDGVVTDPLEVLGRF